MAPRAGRRRALAAALIALLAASGGAAARPFTDAAGRTVELPERVGRVLAAGPPAAVLLYTLAPDLMAGWVSAPHPAAMPFLEPRTRALPAYGRLTGRGGTANVEALLAAKPDLIVDSGSLGPTYASLADRVEEHMGPPLPNVGAGQPVAEAVAALEGADALLVQEDGRPIGVLTRHDLLGHLTA